MEAISRLRFPYTVTTFIKFFARTPSFFQYTQKTLFHCTLQLNVKGEPIKMPSLSPTMEEGKIVKWLKKEGETINPGDVICDIETDKAVVSMEIEEEGILAKILVPENSANVKVGSLIALMVGKDEDWKNVEYHTESLKSTPQKNSSISDSPQKESPSKSTIKGPPSTPIKMPSLSPTMTSGTIIKWLKKEGDTISPGDVLCDIQTDKAVISMETEEEGILAKIILGNDSKDVEVGTLIALMVEPGSDWKSVQATEISTEEDKQEIKITTTVPNAIQLSSDIKGKVFGPAVKTLLATYQIEPGLIKPSGRNNRLLKEDVMNYVDSNKLEKKPPKVIPLPTAKVETKTSIPPTVVETKKQKQAPAKKSTVQSPTSIKYKDIELSNVKLEIAKRFAQTKREIPHSYAVMKCLIDKLVEAKTTLPESNVVSLSDMLIKATAIALQIYPKANALVVNKEVKISNTVDISVSTDSGLYSPVIKSANTKNIVTISQEIKNLTEKGKSGKLKPEEFQGGTFTISNLGMFGVTEYKEIINPPQCCILAIGGTIESLDYDLKKKREMIFSLSYDRRSLEEWEAAEFMDVLKYIIENPNLILKDVQKRSSILGL